MFNEAINIKDWDLYFIKRMERAYSNNYKRFPKCLNNLYLQIMVRVSIPKCLLRFPEIVSMGYYGHFPRIYHIMWVLGRVVGPVQLYGEQGRRGGGGSSKTKNYDIKTFGARIIGGQRLLPLHPPPPLPPDFQVLPAA